MRQLRSRNDYQARPLGNVPGVHGLPGLQDDAAAEVAGTRRALQPDELLDEKCPLCESQLVKKHGQYGEFIGCTAYPKCKFIRSKTLGIKCPKCEVGELTERVAKKGKRRVFYGCNKYPDCDFTTPHLPIVEPCPKCGAHFIVEKRGKYGVKVRFA